MRILLLHTSARGHAIAEALSRSRHAPDIISVSPGRNPGIAKIATEQHVLPLSDFDSILLIAKKSSIDFCIIGPEDPLGAGIVDALDSVGIPCVGPSKRHAQIESSKGFARELLVKYSINASPNFFSFDSIDRKTMFNFIDQKLHGEFVVKYDGLLGGKGVKLSGEHLSSIDEGVSYAEECIRECGRVVIEEKLIGVEFSLMSFVSGNRIVHMPAIQDHKRAFEGDTGPNTGGMGTFSDADHSLPFLSADDIKRAKEINEQAADALEQEFSSPYQGILYGGFIAVKDGVRLIEYNARFGDPEALNVLPILESDFVDICLSIIEGNLSHELVRFKNMATVCKYITPESYPERKIQKDEVVRFPPVHQNSRIYFGDISMDEQSVLHLGGSRSAGIVGIGKTILEAESITQSVCSGVEGPVRFRSDIGTQALIQKRIDAMKHLRGSPLLS